MREIKFRAWHKKAEVMEEVVSFEVGRYVQTICDDKSIAEHDEQYDWGQVALMQFTGLLDKNGKEIYEGDIVKWRSHPKPTKVSEVKWSDKSASFQLHWYDNDLERERGVGSNRSLWALNSIEVIGNIYENSELLK